MVQDKTKTHIRLWFYFISYPPFLVMATVLSVVGVDGSRQLPTSANN
jgi:hypothetical protein